MVNCAVVQSLKANMTSCVADMASGATSRRREITLWQVRDGRFLLPFATVID
jgi:hypothetical protein